MAFVQLRVVVALSLRCFFVLGSFAKVCLQSAVLILLSLQSDRRFVLHCLASFVSVLLVLALLHH